MKKPIKRALIIHSLCTVGKASLTNILPILSILGVEGCPLPSTILSSHTGGFKEVKKIDSSTIVKEGIESLKINDINVDLIFIGYLGNLKDKEFLSREIKEFKGKVILDPILGDNNKLYTGFKEKQVEEMRNLLKGCYLITPNITEALLLTNRDVEDIKNIKDSELKEICRELRELGCENILITSIEREEKIGVGIYRGDKLEIVFREKIEKSYPGTGDIFTGIVVGEILGGRDLKKAVEKAMDFLYETIKESSTYDYDTKEGVLLERNLYRLLEKPE